MSKIRSTFVVVLLAAGHGSVDFYLTLLQALAPGIALRLGMPLGEVVALVGVVQLVTNGVQPLVGWIMGKRNLSWVLWVALLLATLPVFMGWVTTFWGLVLLVVAGGVGTGLFHPEGLLAAHEKSGAYAHLGVPFFMAGGYFFSAATAPIAIHWVDWFGFPALAWLGIPGLLLGLGFFVSHRNDRRNHKSVILKPRSQRITKKEEGRMSFWPLLTIAVFSNIATGLFMAILTSHYELTYGSDARAWAGWVLLAIGGIGSLASFMWGHVCRKGGYYHVVFLTQVVAAPLFLYLAGAPTPFYGFLIALPLSVISPGAVYPVSVSFVRNASGLTQSLRAALIVGGTWGLSAVTVMIAGLLMAKGLPSMYLVVVCSVSCFAAALLAGAEILRARKVRKAKIA